MIIDPQGQAAKFIQKLHTKDINPNNSTGNEFKIVKPGKEMLKYLGLAVRMGYTLMIQNIEEIIDPILDPILMKSIHYSSTSKLQTITIGKNVIEFNPDFKLFLITNLPNPHYTPETLTKITLLNFTITKDGLKDQMLSLICKEEEPKDEEEKLK